MERVQRGREGGREGVGGMGGGRLRREKGWDKEGGRIRKGNEDGWEVRGRA